MKSEPLDKTHGPHAPGTQATPHTQQVAAPVSHAPVVTTTAHPVATVEDNSPKGLLAQSTAAENEHAVVSQSGT